jgi:hypothetical protein
MADKHFWVSQVLHRTEILKQCFCAKKHDFCVNDIVFSLSSGLHVNSAYIQCQGWLATQRGVLNIPDEKAELYIFALYKEQCIDDP